MSLLTFAAGLAVGYFAGVLYPKKGQAVVTFARDLWAKFRPS